MLGSKAWCEKPRISAQAVSSIRIGRIRSVRIAVTNPTTPCHSEPAAARRIPVGAEAGRSATAPAR